MSSSYLSTGEKMVATELGLNVAKIERRMKLHREKSGKKRRRRERFYKKGRS